MHYAFNFDALQQISLIKLQSDKNVNLHFLNGLNETFKWK